MGSGDLNTKKSWHVVNLKNQRKVWESEQAALAERKKVNERVEELRKERQEEEIAKQLEEAGGKKRVDRVDWMYQGPSGENGGMVTEEAEAFLLGKRRIDSLLRGDEHKQLEKNAVPDRFAAAGPVAGGAGEAGAALPPVATSARDMAAKIREDPLLAIKRQEQQSYEAMVNDPIRRRQLMAVMGIKGSGADGRDGKKSSSRSHSHSHSHSHRSHHRSHRHRDDDRDRDQRRDKERGRDTSADDDYERRPKRRRRDDDSDAGSRERSRRDDLRDRDRDRTRDRTRDRERDRDARRSRRDDSPDDRRSSRRGEQDTKRRDGRVRSRDRRHSSPRSPSRSRSKSPPTRRDQSDRGGSTRNDYRNRETRGRNGHSNGHTAANKSDDSEERARKLAAMQANASDLDQEREKRLALIAAKEAAAREADVRARERDAKLTGGSGSTTTMFSTNLRQKVGDMGLAERLGRSRQGLQRDED